MALSSLTAAFNESSDAAKSSISDGFQSQAEDRAFITAEDRPDMDPGFETKAAEDSELTSGDITDPGLTQDDILKTIQHDLDFSYDEETNTLNIVSGEIKPSTMDAVRAYFDMSDGKYDDANIVIGKDVTFKTEVINAGLTNGQTTIDMPMNIVPSFEGIKCNSIDIQSQNIINGDNMFVGVDADIIKVADQPNLESANNMFDGCAARAIVLGEFPEDFSGKEPAENGKNYSLDYMFNGCEAVVMNSDLTDVIYDPAENGIVNPHITPDSGHKINPSNPKIDPENIPDSEKKTPIEKIRELIESKYDSANIEKGLAVLDKIQDRAKQAMDALGIDGIFDPASVEKSDCFEK